MAKVLLGFIFGIAVAGLASKFLNGGPRANPTETTVPASDPSIIQASDSAEGPSVDGSRVQELESELASLRAAVTDADMRIEQLTAALAAAKEEAARRTGPTRPSGYPTNMTLPSEAKPIFDAEPVDISWAQAAEPELYKQVITQISEKGLPISGVDVECRTNACRVLLSYAGNPANESECEDLTRPAMPLAQLLVHTNSAVAQSGILGHRCGFPGQPTTSELYLFRTGTNGIIQTRETGPNFK